MVKDARDFLELHSEEWHIYANHAQATFSTKKDKYPELSPLTEDIKKLRLFLITEIETVMVSIRQRQEINNFLITRNEYSYLQKLVLVRIIRSMNVVEENQQS